MKRLISTLLLVIGLLFSLTPVALAQDQGSCSNPGGGNVSIRLWENAQGDTSDGNDTVWMACNHTAPVKYCCLGNISHTPPGACQAPVKLGDNWNDCVSSITMWGLGSSLWHLCLYRDANYVHLIANITGPVNNGTRQDMDFIASGSNDTLSGFQVINGGDCPPG